MKVTIALVAVGVIISAAYIYSPERVQYNAPEREEVEVNNEPEYPSEWLEAAEKAKEDVLRRKSLEAESTRLEGEIEALKEKKAEIDKELGTY